MASTIIRITCESAPVFCTALAGNNRPRSAAPILQQDYKAATRNALARRRGSDLQSAMETKHSSPSEIRSTPFTISETVKLSVKPLAPEELRKMDAYWRAANFLSVGQI